VFGGTVRSAIDPDDRFNDGTLRNALHRAFMQLSSPSFKELEAFSRCFDLNRCLEGGGANLSLGERALLSLARVLVRDSKIVVLDEAT
jgi:ABC-type multidrug transport system fused ATPase/permease subunit